LKSSTPKLYEYKLKKALKKPEFRDEYENFVNPPPIPEESRTYGTDTMESMMRAAAEADQEETKFGDDEYGDESADSGYGSYDDEDVDEMGQLDPDVVRVKGAAGEVRPMPERTAALEALMAEEEAARQALAEGERDKGRGKRLGGSGLADDDILGILDSLEGAGGAGGAGATGRAGGAASMTRLSILSGATDGTTASARAREAEYGEFLAMWGHVDFSLLFFLPVVKNIA
jgi:hypothetical protein